MTSDQFHNGLRLLRSIDLYELQKVGLWTDAECRTAPVNEGTNAPDEWQQWKSFRDDPYRFFVYSDDETAALIWAAMEKRMKPGPAAVNAQMLAALQDALLCMETDVKIQRPEWDGYATPTSAVGQARAAIAAATEAAP